MSYERFLEALHPDDRDRTDQAVQVALDTRTEYDIEYRAVWPDESVRWLAARGHARYADDGNPVRMEGVVLDINVQKLAQLETEQLYHELEAKTAQLKAEIAERHQADISQQETELRLRDVLDNTPAVIYIKDTKLRYTFVNRSFELLFDMPLDEIRGKTDYDIFAGDVADAFRRNDERVLGTGEVLDTEESAPHLDGMHTYLSTKFPLRNLEGTTYALAGISTDITKRREAELERDRFFSMSIDLLAVMDTDGHFRRLSPSFETTLGYRLDDMLNQPFHEFLHPDDLAGSQGRLEEIQDGKTVLGFENRYRCADGSWKWLSWNAQPYPAENVLYATARDVTEERNAKQEMRITFDRAAIGIAHVAPDGRWLRVNDKLCEITGYSREELLAKTFYDITHPDDRDAELAYVQQMLDGEIQTYSMEKRYYRRDGEIIWILLNVALVRSPDGDPLHFISAVQDIDDTKRMRAELRLHAEQLAVLNEELQHFAYIASHDLQEPLRSISGYVQLLKRRYADKLDEKANGYVDKSVAAVTRMQDLINDLLAYSRLTSRGESYEEVDCNVLMEDVLSNLNSGIEKSGTDIQCGPLPAVLADRTQLAQVFQNLIGNAIKFTNDKAPIVKISATRESGEVTPDTTETTNGRWTFAVSDNGIGMDLAYADRVFQMFQRLHTRQEYSGTGIGLAICKKVIERHGGRIWVESKPGEGSTFFFTLSGLSE